MPKKIFLSIIILSLCFCSGCQRTLFDEENNSPSIAKSSVKSGYPAWIYIPSTRTIKNTMSEYATPLEFTVDDIIVTERLAKAKNLKSAYQDDLNSFIENLGSDFGDVVLSNIDFAALQEQTGLPSESLQNRISIDGALSFIGPYDSIQLIATPSIINKDTNELIELYSLEENIYYISKFYNVKEKKEATTQELFLKDYMTALERCIQNKILLETEEPFNTLKRSFSNLSENDFSLYYDSGIDTDTLPRFFITLNEQNPYCFNETTIELSLSVLLPYLSFSPNEIESIMDIPNLLTKQLIDTTDTFSIEQDTSITADDCDDTFFIAVRNYKNQDMTDQVNDQLSISQKIYAGTTPILNYSSKADSISCKVISFKALGPFLKVFILSNATVNNQYLFNQKNILIHMPTGEQLAVRDLLLPQSIDTLTDQQLQYLDSTDFSLESSGRIVVPLQPPTEEGNMNLVYESKLFDFSKYSNF